MNSLHFLCSDLLQIELRSRCKVFKTYLTAQVSAAKMIQVQPSGSQTGQVQVQIVYRLL